MAIRMLLAAFTGASSSVGLSFFLGPPAALMSSPEKSAKVVAGMPKPGLPEISEAEVAAKNGIGGSVWVIYRAGVYDVTDFIEAHPGGRKRIMLAAGSSIEPFWKLFTVHDSDEVREILERHRIGNLKGFDHKLHAAKQAAMEALAAKRWDNEPKRHPALEIKSARPFNAQTPAAALTDMGNVPNDLFFVRNHMAVPVVDSKTFCLELSGEGLRDECITVEELRKKFPQHTISTSIQCGGNRRMDATAAGQDVKGLAWTCGAIGTAEWTGVWLRDILNDAAGGHFPHAETHHVHFGGLDSDDASKFEVSIPAKMAMNPNRDVLIAHKMNGEDIPRDHGYPLRAIVPGTVGVRNCKWLGSIKVHPEESQSDWQQRDYKNYPPWVKSPEEGHPSVYDMPVQSQVTESTRDGKWVTMKGYAYCGGGRGVQRVDLSIDGGATFTRSAELSEAGIKQPPGKRWSWYQWTTDFDLPDEKKPYKVCSRAISGTEDVQPPVASFSFRGLLYNGYSCVDL